MKEVIIEVIREGWKKNLPVSKVIDNIVSATGLYYRFAEEQFTELVFMSK